MCPCFQQGLFLHFTCFNNRGQESTNPTGQTQPLKIASCPETRQLGSLLTPLRSSSFSRYTTTKTYYPSQSPFSRPSPPQKKEIKHPRTHISHSRETDFYRLMRIDCVLCQPKTPCVISNQRRGQACEVSQTAEHTSSCQL